MWCNVKNTHPQIDKRKKNCLYIQNTGWLAYCNADGKHIITKQAEKLLYTPEKDWFPWCSAMIRNKNTQNCTQQKMTRIAPRVVNLLPPSFPTHQLNTSTAPYIAPYRNGGDYLHRTAPCTCSTFSPVWKKPGVRHWSLPIPLPIPLSIQAIQAWTTMCLENPTIKDISLSAGEDRRTAEWAS